MNIRRNRDARATSATRREFQASTLTTAALARRCCVCEETVAKWRKRGDVQDASHCPHRLQTTLTPAREAVVLVELRDMSLLALDDMLCMVKGLIDTEVSRFGMGRGHSAAVHRYGVSRQAGLRP
jgi:hypothetical protein